MEEQERAETFQPGACLEIRVLSGGAILSLESVAELAGDDGTCHSEEFEFRFWGDLLTVSEGRSLRRRF